MAETADPASPRIATADLIRFIGAAYRAVGIAAPEAQRAAELMAASDLSGADGHGVSSACRNTFAGSRRAG